MRGRCPELRKLPKATRFSSINFRNQTPGSVISFFPQSDQYYGSKQLLDPTHPSANLKLSAFPAFRGKEIGGVVYPIARLFKPSGASVDSRPFFTWTQRVRKAREDGFSATLVGRTPRLLKRDDGAGGGGKPRLYSNDEGQVYPKEDDDTFLVTGRRSVKSGPLTELALKKAAFRVPMSYKNATSKKRMGSLAHMRRDITRRVKVALGLIMARGAYVDASSGKAKIQFNDEDVGRKWSMQGWTYIFFPTIELYSMPYHQLIPKVRQLLESLNSQAVRLENSWMANSLLSERGVSSVNPESKQMRGRTRFQNDRPGTNKAQPLKDQRSSDSSQRAMASGNQLTHKQPSLDAASHADAITKPYKPPPKPTATAAKPHETWKSELMAGMAVLAQQPRKGTPPKKTRSERSQSL